MTVQSKELTYFYRKYKEWLDNEAPDGQPFYRHSGLCTSLMQILNEDEEVLVGEELQEQFSCCGLSSTYPFGEDSFDTRCADGTQHLDHLRIKWVEDHLKPEFTGEY